MEIFFDNTYKHLYHTLHICNFLDSALQKTTLYISTVSQHSIIQIQP